MTEKVLGYTLLALGIMIIIFSCISVWSVFTKRSKPVALFNLKGISIDTSQMMPPEYVIAAKQAGRVLKQEIISGEMLNETSNIFAHLLFMGFIASIGAKLATIGTQLIRPIQIKLKTAESTISK